jgi:hypothetical protein
VSAHQRLFLTQLTALHARLPPRHDLEWIHDPPGLRPNRGCTAKSCVVEYPVPLKVPFAFLLRVFLLVFVAVAPLAQEMPLAFDWAFVRRATDGSAVPIDFKEKVSIASDDLFKIYVKPVRGAYLYLFLHDASDELSMLFPASFDLFATPSYYGTQVFVPPGNAWFRLDGTSGVERFYLLVSRTRLATLETVMLALQKVSGDKKSSVTARNAARKSVLDEIARVRKAHSTLTAAAEKPVTFAGGTRGVEIAKKATRIEAGEFYTRTFRLEH